MKLVRKSLPFLFLLPFLYFLFPFSSEPSDHSRIDALAPVEVLTEGFKEPTGVAVDQTGAIFVSDRQSGDIFRIVGRDVRLLVRDLRRPVGLAFDREGRLLIVEEKRGVLLRSESDGRLAVLAQGMKKPRWVAVAEDGAIYVSAQRLRGDREGDDDEGEEDGEVILRLTTGGQLSIFTDRFEGLQGILIHGRTIFAAAKGARGDSRDGIFQISILADGSAGPIGRASGGTRIEKSVGLARDSLGALYFGADEIRLEREHEDAIGKISDGTVSRFASRLEKPKGLAFDSSGNLYVADDRGDRRGRILRFRAPAAPNLVFPSYTNQNPLTIQGSTGANSRIDAFLNDSVTPITVFTQDGAFALNLNLLRNAQNSLHVFSTAHSGQGLTSAPAEITIVHDDIPPVISIVQPLNGAYLNTRTPVIRSNFSDNLSGIDVGRVRIELDGANVTSQAQVTANGFILSMPLPEGSHTVSIRAFDRAGNQALASTTFTVDVTPPKTLITGGPEGTISATSVTFTVTGTDNLTPSASLEFSWRLDGGPFSPFSRQTQISLSGLTPGPHTFEVKARDLAGNEDPTPARRTFTVSLLTVRITEPRDGASVAPGSLIVRGTVESGGIEVGVLVNGFGAAVQGSSFAALIPVNTGTTSLTAVATTAAGATASHRVAVSVSPTPAPAVALGGSPRSGVAPLRVEFSLLGGVVPTRVDLDANGNGTIDFTGPTLEGRTFTYTQRGLYFPTVTITDARGNRLTVSAIVQVLERSALDTMLQAKWTGMKDALRRGDIPSALSNIAIRSRAKYEEAFQIIRARLPNIDAILPGVTVVEIGDRSAIYEATRTDAGLVKSFEVRFALDGDGIWRVEAF